MPFRTLVVLFLLILKGPAQAGLLIEPYMGFESGNQAATVSSAHPLFGGAKLDAKIVNTVLGGRIGYAIPIGWLALDSSLGSSGKTTYLESSTATSNTASGPNFTRTTVGASLGTDVGPKHNFRLWAGYIFSDLLVHNTNVKNTYKGTGYKLGVGIVPMDFLSLNLEYIVRKYTSATGDTYATGLNFGDQYAKLEHSTIVMSISAPFFL